MGAEAPASRGWVRQFRYDSTKRGSPCLRRACRVAAGPKIIYALEIEKSRLGVSRLFCSVGLLRRGDCNHGLQAQGNDLGSDHFARDD